MTNLPDISFAERDPAVIETQIITIYEALTGRSLARADPVRLFLESVAAIIVQQRSIIDYTGKMNLLAYAGDGYLEHLGHLLGVERLEATAAATTLRFEISTPLAAVQTVPKGTRATPDGKIYFATTGDAEIPAGETAVEVAAECTQTGPIGNDYLPGQIARIVDPLPWLQGVSNVTASAGGADLEDKENFRDRIRLAPEYFSVAGPSGSYEYWARTAHQDIVDVAVIGPPDTQPGNVEIYPLMKGGEIPPQEILDRVFEILDAEKIRPDTDYVHVLPPAPVTYNLRVTYWIERGNATQAAALQKKIEQAAQNWMLWQRSKLGRDLNPSELNHRMVAAGAKRTEILSPAFTVLTRSQMAVPDEAEILYGGLEDA